MRNNVTKRGPKFNKTKLELNSRCKVCKASSQLCTILFCPYNTCPSCLLVSKVVNVQCPRIAFKYTATIWNDWATRVKNSKH